MSQYCPRCRTVQAEENSTCVGCGAPLSVQDKIKTDTDAEAPIMPLFTFTHLGSEPSMETCRKEELEEESEEGSEELLKEQEVSAVPPLYQRPIVQKPDFPDVTEPETVESRRSLRRGPLWAVLAALVIFGAIGLSYQRLFPAPSPTAIATMPPANPPQQPVATPAITAEKPAAAVKSASPALPSLPAVSAVIKPVHHPPLTVSLKSSTSQSIVAGKAVTILATTPLSPGRITVLTIAYHKGQGPSRLLAQAQGTLCRAVWTPAVPGDYSFTAKALDTQSQRAAAHPLVLHVASALPPAPGPIASSVPTLPQKPSLQKPLPKIASTGADRHSARRHTTVKHMADVRVAANLPAPPNPMVSSQSPTKFHVAAAAFPYKRNAAILATALHNRGLPAVVRQRKEKNGKSTYLVQIGVFADLHSAHQQSLKLQRDGYPAYTYRAP